MPEQRGWFEVDKDGLAKLLKRKGPEFILYELVQNAWDTGATRVTVELLAIPGRPHAKLRVEDDDPDGFKFLSHGYVLFAESVKKGDPTKRGRFNLGEKLVLAACEEACLSSTTGTVYFESDGAKSLKRRETKERRDRGSLFEAELKMTRAEMQRVLDCSELLLAPISTTINGVELQACNPLHFFEATLPTEIADEEGFLRRTQRRTRINIHPPIDGQAYLYELGIPVVELDLPWSVEIMQKIPLNSDRDNVTPAYRRELGVLVLNEMHSLLTPEDARRPIFQEALASEDVSVDAVNTVLTHQFGDKRTVFDPSDPEANSKAFAHGYNVIPGGAFPKPVWENIRRSEAALPSGRLFPSPKLYGDGPPVRTIPESEWSPGMKGVARYAKTIAKELLNIDVTVVMENEFRQPYAANYGGRCLTFNVPKLRQSWFNLAENFERITDLIIHELGHEISSNHLDEAYHKALTKFAGKLTYLALTRPSFFKDYFLATTK